MYCRKCGKEIADDSAFCPHCGTSAHSSSEQQTRQPVVVNVVNNNSNQNINGGFGYTPKSRWGAFFLCLFLGEIGAHRFYVGKIGTGIIWLLTVGFFGIGWLIDLLRLLIGSFKDKDGHPLQ